MVVGMPRRDPRDRQVERDVQASQLDRGCGGHVRRGRGCLGPEFELDGGSVEEPIGAVQHAQLEQLDLGLRPRVVRHGRQYTHAP